MTISKCTMTGCGKTPTHQVVLAIPGGVAGPDGTMDKGALIDAAVFPACQEHVDHIAKIFYSAAYALDGTVTTDRADAGSARASAA